MPRALFSIINLTIFSRTLSNFQNQARMPRKTYSFPFQRKKTYHIIYNFLKDFFHDRNYKNSFVIILLTYFAEMSRELIKEIDSFHLIITHAEFFFYFFIFLCL